MQATVFAQEMGAAMHDVPVFGTDFNTWFPLVVVVYCTLLYVSPHAACQSPSTLPWMRSDVVEITFDCTMLNRMLSTAVQQAFYILQQIVWD